MSKLVTDATGNDLTYRIIGAAMAVHNFIGPGYKEEVYERALAAELRDRGIGVERQFRVEVVYDGAPVGLFYLDLFVERTVVVEVKAFAHQLTNDERAQVINYLKATQAPVALVFNFGRRRLDWIRVFPGRDGPIMRVGRDDVRKSGRRNTTPPEYIPLSKRAAPE
ncbi:MAG: GxxExxY protein [Chloroflexi bacterium]|nr:MAG: GxxExxY protein [Chloroflexota bacterium]